MARTLVARAYFLEAVLLVLFLWIATAESLSGQSADSQQQAMATRAQTPGDNPQAKVTVDADGTVHLPAVSVPLSSLSSEESKKNFLDFVHGFASLSKGEGGDTNVARKRLDDLLMRPGVERLRSAFAVEIRPEMIGGVQTDVIEPSGGVAKKNKERVLINLHGGGFIVGARLGGQMESIPIAAIGAIKVVTVDYREGPEYRFPAATEDVAAVYRELLKSHSPKNIGIYGCSAGAILAAESVAWFQTHQIPQPGAIGMFGAGAIVDVWGDSNYVGSALMGGGIPSTPPGRMKQILPYFSASDLDLKGPLVSPVYSPKILAKFPPSLLISGTRDVGLSPVVYTHAQLVKTGATSELHVWEGTPHCSFAQPVVNPNEPESREAWDVIVKFFDANLGR
jgi:epsilon-lactone hydrolase